MKKKKKKKKKVRLVYLFFVNITALATAANPIMLRIETIPNSLTAGNPPSNV